MKLKIVIQTILLLFIVACNKQSDKKKLNVEMTLKSSGVCSWGSAKYTWVGDFNGDGKSDIASAKGKKVYMYLSSGLDFIYQTWTLPKSWVGYATKTWLGDFDGDGKSDIASVQGGSVVYVYLSTGRGFNSYTWKVAKDWGSAAFTWVGDFNGDGKSDLASRKGGNVYMKLSTGSEFKSETWTFPYSGVENAWVGDFNGDGKTDIASAKKSNIYVSLSTGSKFNSTTWKADLPRRGAPVASTWVGDFNGDGKSDLASSKRGNVYMKLSTGSKFNSTTWTVPYSGVENAWVGDFNGDGKLDIASRKGGDVYMHLSTGSKFNSTTWTVPDVWNHYGYTWLGDFNGDGKSDIASLVEECNINMHLGLDSHFANQTWYASDNAVSSTMPPYQSLTAMPLLDVWGEGRLTCHDMVTGFTQAYNINKLPTPSNCNEDPIPNLILVSEWDNPKFDLPDDFVKYITLMGSEISVGTAKEMYRVLNKSNGVVILYDMENSDIKNFEENKGRLIYKPNDPLNAPFDQIKLSKPGYRIYGFPNVPDKDEL